MKKTTRKVKGWAVFKRKPRKLTEILNIGVDFPPIVLGSVEYTVPCTIEYPITSKKKKV